MRPCPSPPARLFWSARAKLKHRVARVAGLSNEGRARAIRAYAKVGFRPVGGMRRYDRRADGRWADNLLMDLLAEELAGER